MERINGFECRIESQDNNHLDYQLKHGSIGIHYYKDDEIVVCVQTSIKKWDEAERIASYYKDHVNDYSPSRNTNGSFILIDKKNNLVFCGRDRNQASHLYSYKKDNFILISTDIHSIISINKTLDAVAVDLAVMNGIVLCPFPLFKGVKAHMPGHYFVIDSSLNTSEHSFWKIESVEVPNDYLEAVKIYGRLLSESISNNISNDTAAVYLSGGSDSAAVMGALYHLGVKNVHAAHMDIRGNFEFEGDDVRLLQKRYGFNLEYITPKYQNTIEWKDYVEKSILNGSINSVYISYPTYQLMGKRLSELVPEDTSVFNGEMCLLDQGFNVSSDKTRHLRRWLFVGSGRKLGFGIKVAPDFINVNWEKHRKAYVLRNKWSDRFFVIDGFLRSFFHSIGRPEEYFAGLKLGYQGLPGYYLGLSLLPPGYKAEVIEKANTFFGEFLEALCSSNWKQGTSMMSTCWYSESSNFTMPNDTASIGGLSMCFPFSSVELMDFAASVPSEWAKDKRIQKDACKVVYDMPDQVAYRMKNHSQAFSYFDTIYGSMKDDIINTIRSVDFGPLNEGINSLLNHKLLDGQIFSLYGFALWIRAYNLRVE